MPDLIIPPWDECTKSSNWFEPIPNPPSDRTRRTMNILAPEMYDEISLQRFRESKYCDTSIHGVDHFNVFLSNNQFDGSIPLQNNPSQYGVQLAYSIYGNTISWNINDVYCDLMKSRLDSLHDNGYGIILWLMASNNASNTWNEELLNHWDQYCLDIHSQGFFDYASTVVIGEKVDDYCTSNKANECVSTLRYYYNGKIGVHTSDLTLENWSELSCYYENANIIFASINKGKTSNDVKDILREIYLADFGDNNEKAIYAFKLDTIPNRYKCNTAINSFTYGVGNWKNSYIKDLPTT